MFIRSLLAIPQAITDNFKWIAIGAAALLGVIALICGLCKGFYRTSRRWIKFISVVSLFFFLCARFIDQNPIEKIAFVKNLADDLRLAVIVGSYLLASIVAVNIVFGIIDAIVKAAAIKKLEKSVAVSTKKDPREREREQRAIDKKWKPNAFSRLCGGVACVLNVGICAGFIAALIVYACSYSSRLTGDIFAFVYNDLPEKVLDYLRAYALDSVALLFILSVSYCGYRAGALNGLRAVFMTFGIVAAVGFGIAVPFLASNSQKTVFTPVVAVTDWFSSMFEKASAEFVSSRAKLFGKLAAGVSLALVFALVFALFGLLLKAITRTIRRVAVIRIIDGSLCFIVTFAVAVAAVAAVAAVMLSLEYVGVFKGSFKFTSLFTDKSPLQNVFKDLFDNRLTQYLDAAKDAMTKAAG